MKPTVRLIRLEENYDFGTFGVITIDSQIFCVSLEPSDELNVRNISSIPAQQYVCKRTTSPLIKRLTKGKLNDTFEVLNVPGRSGILFHSGNLDEHTEGCIIVAEKFGKLRGERAVLNSGATFLRFMALMEEYDEFILTIKEEY